MSELEIREIKEMVGNTIIDYVLSDDEITFYMANNTKIRFYHSQDCCENVHIESIDGDLDDLVDKPLNIAEFVSSCLEYDDGNEILEGYEISPKDDSTTWTFYKFATINGYVTIRFVGYSNGYYSESVDMLVTDAIQECRDIKLKKIN